VSALSNCQRRTFSGTVTAAHTTPRGALIVMVDVDTRTNAECRAGTPN